MNKSWWALLGLVAVASGAALFVERVGGTTEVVAIGRRWWPVLLIGLGLANLIRNNEYSWAIVGPLLAVGAGTVLLLFTFDIIEGASVSLLWPAALALTGGALVLAMTLRDPDELRGRGDLHRVVWLRGERLESRASPFWYGRITVLGGLFSLDLRRARVHNPTVIHVTVLFGTVEVQLEGATVATVRRPFVLGIRGMVPSDAPRNTEPQVTVSVLALFGDAKLRQPRPITPPTLPSIPTS